MIINFKDETQLIDIKINKKYNYRHMSQVHMSTISSFSKDPSNFSNSSFNFISISINSTKLESLLQSTLSSLCQFLLTKIKISRSHCKWHLLRFVRILANEKIYLVSTCDFGMPRIYLARNPTIGNNDSSFSHHSSGHLISLISKR
jgi:hypothetical protein